ncbi:MAG TPA: hypothetical protein VJZ27_08985, partial [Aggregatilineales bacterium]|nr:hypothetical protein [Aggregatilineales bacterium]
WGNAYVDIYDDTANGLGYLQLDNINVQHQPALVVTTTECVDPSPLVVTAAEVPERGEPLEDVPLDASEVAGRSSVDSLNADAIILDERSNPEPAAPVEPPVVETMDDGAPNWSASGSWILTSDADADGIGSGWQASVGVEPATLTLYPMLDLRSTSNPSLSFQTQIVSSYSSANVEVSFDGVNWLPVAILSASNAWQNTTVDLSAYRGQMIALRFVWLSRLAQPTDPGVDMWLLDEVVIENAPQVVTEPTDEAPTSEPTETTPVPTPDETEIPAPTPEPTEETTESAPPAEDVPLDAEPPTR